MNINRSLLNEDMIAPHLVQQLRTAMDSLGVCHQIVKQLEFCRAEFQRIVTKGHPVS